MSVRGHADDDAESATRFDEQDDRAAQAQDRADIRRERADLLACPLCHGTGQITPVDKVTLVPCPFGCAQRPSLFELDCREQELAPTVDPSIEAVRTMRAQEAAVREQLYGGPRNIEVQPRSEAA